METDNNNELFEAWFNGPISDYTLISEWFYGDCELENPESRRTMLKQWLIAAYSQGYVDCKKRYADRE